MTEPIGPIYPGDFTDPDWPDIGPATGDRDPFFGSAARRAEGTDREDSESRNRNKNTREIAIEATESTRKIKEDLEFIKERLHELVNETSTHEQERASLEKTLASLDGDMVDEEYSPTIPNQDLFAIDVDKLIKDLGKVFRTEKEIMEEDGVDRDNIKVVAAHVGHVLWEHLRLPTELYDAWVESTGCGHNPE